MGKNRKKKHKERRTASIATPSFLSPVCPTCGRPDKLISEHSDDDPMYECTRCWVRFMYEDSSVEIEDGSDIEVESRAVTPVQGLKCALCRGKGCEVCKPTKKKELIRTTEPVFGEMEELTSAVPVR